MRRPIRISTAFIPGPASTRRIATQSARSAGNRFDAAIDRDFEGTLGHIECLIVETHEAGDHVIHLGEVQDACTTDGQPLLFFRGKYRQLRDPG